MAAGVDDRVIELSAVSKHYSLETNPARRLWRQLIGRTERGPQHPALQDVSFSVRRGEAVGLIGRNGAGKSTLLQLVCGVLQPSAGKRYVRGRVAALLELGAGFNPELSGRENVRLNGPLLGLSRAEIERRLPEIIDFAGIGDYIDQPVRSYSSGMFVRLAFAMATSVEPDILVIDEALSVGDGQFARKSFERIMALRERGATVLFCSHSMFQVEALCQRALWLHDGRVQFDGPSHQAVVEYSAWSARADAVLTAPDTLRPSRHDSDAATLIDVRIGAPLGSPSNGATGNASYRSGLDDLDIHIHFRSDPTIPCPTLGLVLHSTDGRAVTSAGNWLDGVDLERDAAGEVRARLHFPALPLLKGRYTVSAYVLDERSINLYAAAEHVASFDVVQDGLQQGLVALPHRWEPSRAS